MLVSDEENNIRVDNKEDYMKFFDLDDSVNASVDHSYEVFLKSMKKEGREMKYERDDGSHYRFRAENPKRKRCSQEAVVKTNHDCRRKIEHKIVDHSYEVFLEYMKKEGRNMIFTPETGAKVVYDEDESSDSEVIVMDSDPFANEKHTPFVTNLEDEGSKWLESSCKNEHSWFRERVTEILRQPFDPIEYDKLFGEAYYKKPAIVEKDMRNGRTRHIIGQGISHSYLDQYIGNVNINLSFNLAYNLEKASLSFLERHDRLNMHTQCFN
ncbi:uncharacterized protein LOC130015238 [Mercurialis annua]|uniref:uncharacterized protein LOC130015238 n=1 Tax=Mercurialis annua TaxID=3986 RepID=UPI0024ACFCF9|nr:uncharacterized protein LOC130015238 [Mercurialis annua]